MTANPAGTSVTRTQLVVRHATGQDETPLAIVNGFPGLDAEMTAEDLALMARQLNQIANDLRMGVKGIARYPEDVQ